MRRAKRMRARVLELERELGDERAARHAAEISAAAARGELRGYRSATDQRVLAVREDARHGRELSIT
jgi:hypothetical protein